MAVIDNVKALLGIEDEDKKLNIIITLTENRLKALLNVDTVPSELEYIVTEVSIARFNRIGSEGLSGHTVEGEALTFKDNDFDQYADDIQAWRDAQSDQDIGRIRFL
jgi:hypothetical protein